MWHCPPLYQHSQEQRSGPVCSDWIKSLMNWHHLCLQNQSKQAAEQEQKKRLVLDCVSGACRCGHCCHDIHSPLRMGSSADTLRPLTVQKAKRTNKKCMRGKWRARCVGVCAQFKQSLNLPLWPCNELETLPVWCFFWFCSIISKLYVPLI